MYAFNYEHPKTLADASKLAKAGGQALAGGQTLLASMKQRLMQPEQLVDLRQIPELVGVRKEGDELVIGAMTKHAEVEHHALVKQHIPALAALAGGIGDRQVRAMGTLGGSVANNDPAACYPSALMALDATVHTDSRQISAQDFFLGMYATALNPGELITAVSFPIPKRAAYAKFKQGASRFAMVGVFVADTTQGVRVAVTGASSGVFRHAGLEAALTKNFAPEAVAGVVVDDAELNSDIHASASYRAQLIKVQTRVAVQQALA